jgi:hypothetical protein
MGVRWVRLKAELLRAIELIELLLLQIAAVETERDSAAEFDTAQDPSPIALLTRLRGIGSQIASVLYFEGLYRHFGNRREVLPMPGWRRRRGAAGRPAATPTPRPWRQAGARPASTRAGRRTPGLELR